MPHEIRCDIRNLVGAMQGTGVITCDELFGRRDSHVEERGQLARDRTFSLLAGTFERNFLACSMIDIARHRRKVVHLSYEELLVRSKEVPWPKRLISLARGGARDVVITVPRASAAESSHVEVVAPDLLQIVDRRQVSKDNLGRVDQDVQRPSGHKRAHFHFGGAGSEGAVTVTVIPTATTHTRLAALASALGLVAILVVLLAAPGLRDGEASVDAAAAVLLSFSAIIGLFAATKDSGTNMVQELLWPVQLLSLTPVLWTFLAGLTILAPLDVTATQVCFGALAVLNLACTAQLVATAREATTPVRSGLATQES